ncbi:conserved hypothetical protein [uncultured Desulfobacterium sp.]|uniref:Uncharacterized protein n=1 Tax=uncultured Desulfobacterium sp. TaxID=201089 RepID=A0A445MYU1_9BACT|nr:conserved hypothetical protein [uncultured Desulfobacterium sp.]
MESENVIFFEPYPFRIGQKINIKAGPRRGDWLVIDVSDRKVKFRCPVSLREFEWDLFCYFVEEKTVAEWPHRH